MEIIGRVCDLFSGRGGGREVDETFSSDGVGDTLVLGTETYYRVRSSGGIFNIAGMFVDPITGEAEQLVSGSGEAGVVSRRMDQLKDLGRR